MKRSLFLLCGAITVSFGGVAFAREIQPPVINKVWVWNIGSTEAGLSVSYTPDLAGSKSHFEYSTNPDLSNEQKTPLRIHVGPAFAEQGMQEHAELKGLRPNTVYYYRAYVRTNYGEKFSAIQNFRTAR
jgi:hypothetical protein